MMITTGTLHHVTLTVTDVARSEQFYTGVLGFHKVREFGPRAILSNGSVRLVLTPPPDPTRALENDRFDENRVGLDHLSLSVGTRADLDRALGLFEERGVPHGEVKDLGPDSGLYVLAFRDPDNIQLELSAPHAG